MAGRRYALLIASSDYEDPALSELVAPARDADELAEVLSHPDIGGFETKILVNEASFNVRQAIEEFYIDRNRNDLLLLYLSGHGIKDETGQLYFATQNTQRKLLRSTAVAAGFINEVMRHSRSRRQVLLLDSCFSGAFAKGMTVRADAAIDAGEYFKEGRGQAVITASDSMQYAFEGDAVSGSGVGSVFTSNLVRGLRTGEADLNKDGTISLDEIYQYLYDKVSAQMPEQKPRKWVFDLEGGLSIAKNINPVAADLPEDIQQSLEDSRVFVREAVIKELVRLLHGKHRGLAQAAREALESLREDDSRKVSSAAEEALAAHIGSAARPKQRAKPVPEWKRHIHEEAKVEAAPHVEAPAVEVSERHRKVPASKYALLTRWFSGFDDKAKSVWRRWMSKMTLTWCLVFFVTDIIARISMGLPLYEILLNPRHNISSDDALFFGGCFGLVVALAVSLVQHNELRCYLPVTKAWVVANSIVGGVVGAFVLVLAEQVLYELPIIFRDAVMWGSYCLVLGVVQAFFLRKYCKSVFRWIRAGVIGVMLGAVIFGFLLMWFGWVFYEMYSPMAGAVIGFFYGVFTGRVLITLRRKHSKHPDDPLHLVVHH